MRIVIPEYKGVKEMLQQASGGEKEGGKAYPNVRPDVAACHIVTIVIVLLECEPEIVLLLRRHRLVNQPDPVTGAFLISVRASQIVVHALFQRKKGGAAICPSAMQGG